MKSVNKIYTISLIFIILGCLSFLMYAVNGSYVDTEGFLIESFGFIPLGYLFIFLGMLVSIVTFIYSFFRKK